MNQKIPESLNLEEYNKMLHELENLEENQLEQTEITIKLRIPIIIAETIKLIATLFYQIPTEKYVSSCVLSSVSSDFDRLLRHHQSHEKLYKLMEKTESGL